ncbi:MAG TPA: hypothetical protein VGW35_12955 [Methylomirabilota bacterium]|jgi:hypothetical protein|nr:hypothetical protein [Methylomirabilota bacterium]
MNTRVPLIAVWLLAWGCAAASGPPASSPAASALLARADDQLVAGQYRGAVSLYDELLRAHVADPATARARATRAVLDRLLLAQGEIERLHRELASRQVEIDRLRADLDRLRSIDLRQPPRTR